MKNRCLRELNTAGAEQAAEKMEMTDGTKSIGETDLAESVLTLTEVLMTFEVESDMFNIAMPSNTQRQGNGHYRTVIFKKHQVEIDGQTKLIIMIRDVTDKVLREQE